MLGLDHDAVDELVVVDGADELCRLLLEYRGGWRRSIRHAEAVELLSRVRGTGELPFSVAVLLVCTCQRWERVTAKLIAAIDDSGLLDASELDELADAFLARNHVITYPLAWVSPQWLEIGLEDGTTRTDTVTEDTLTQHHLRPQPPLRRWAARHALQRDPGRLVELLGTAEQLEPRHRDSAIHGLLDAASKLDGPARRTVVDRGLRAARGSVRIAALELLCELDGPDTALRRAAADPDAQVRKWQPPADDGALSLFVA